MSHALREKERAEKLERLGRWVKETCAAFGAEPHTGYLVAGVFTKSLAAEWEKQDTEKQPKEVTV